VTEPSRAVFLSYASQDAPAAGKICAALRAAGIEVWFDQSELRGGDAWDQAIRKQIRTCALFIPVISRHTHERREGYFRLEWNLAVDRSRLISTTQAFLVPVVIDDTREDDEEVPEKIRDVHWTRLPGGVTPTAFVERVQHLLAGGASIPLRADATAGFADTSDGRSPAAGWSRRVLPVAVAVVVLAAMGYLVVDRPWVPKPAAPAGFAPPPHSIAVLPFVNMSGDRDQEYFSEGLTEELLNSLSEIDQLQVAARTSSFSFEDKQDDVATIARKLNVASVLEGSVRRSGNTVRITAQLINAATGFHLWSKSYDRDLSDVLKLQTEVATAVAAALKITLLGNEAAKIELGGTRNPAAFDAYLRGRRIGRTASDAAQHRDAISAYTQAISLDSGYASAFAERSLAFLNYRDFVSDPAAVHEACDRALADARSATTLAPELAEGYYALGAALTLGSLDFARADEAFARAVALAPGNARILAAYSRHTAERGHAEAAIDAGRRAIALDPLNFHTHRTVGIALLDARQYPQALAAFQTAISLQPDYLRNYVLAGETQYYMGAYEAARKSCEMAPADQLGQKCLAMTYRKLGRNDDAEAMLRKLRAAEGDTGADDYAAIYAQWGDTAQALEWLETAVRLRNPDLMDLNRQPLFEPLHEEPRFRAIVRQLNRLE
jgi:TolB-like protein/Flp pilus assembly protein TadD